MKYIITYDGFRFLTSEIAIASGRRCIPENHWSYAADKIIERVNRYRLVVNNVDFLLLPTKVTSLSFYLTNYFPRQKIISWSSIFLEKILEKDMGFQFYYNPSLVSKKNLFFKNDSHWNCWGALSYFEPWIKAKFSVKDEYFQNLQRSTTQCIGNCLEEAEKKQHAESYDFLKSENFNIVFSLRNKFVPDFSIVKTTNSKSLIKERVLIVHSSSYEFARGFFSPLFEETIEVFSPYVSDSVIDRGKFDRVIVIMAERNAAVVYDGGEFGEVIKKSLKQNYIAEIIKELRSSENHNILNSSDISFFEALASLWEGV